MAINPIITINKQMELDTRESEIRRLNVAKGLFNNSKRSMRIVVKSKRVKVIIDGSITVMFE